MFLIYVIKRKAIRYNIRFDFHYQFWASPHWQVPASVTPTFILFVIIL